MVERQQDHRGPNAKTLGARRDGGGDDERRGQKPVLVLMVLAEEARVETARLGELGLGDGFVDAAIEMLAAWRVRDRAVEAELHGSPRPRWGLQAPHCSIRGPAPRRPAGCPESRVRVRPS